MRRIWDDAIAKRDAEGKCRGCGRDAYELAKMGRRLEFAHLSGRKFDPPHPEKNALYVRPESGAPLCGPATSTDTCHAKQEAGELDLIPVLSNEEAACAVLDLGLYRAFKNLGGEV